MDIESLVPALGKLADYAASGIGSVAGPMLASWKARREANAKLIAAKGEAEAQRILAEGQATTMQIIANAQADARSILVSPDSIVQGQLELGAAVSQRIQFQEKKRQSNIRQVVTKAALELEGKEVRDHEPDHDWTARFFNDVQDVSSEEMQQLWGKILAGEVEMPGSTSLRTLSILKNLDQSTANTFQRLCSACVLAKSTDASFVDARVPSLGGNPGNNVLEKYGFSYDVLNALNEHGLIISEYNSWYDHKMSIGIPLSAPFPGQVVCLPFTFQGRYWVLVPTTQREASPEFKLSGVALTRSGREMSRIVEMEPMEEYMQDLMTFFESSGFQMTEVTSNRLQVFQVGNGPE